MRLPEVRPYWEILFQKRRQLVLKRFFDFSAALILLLALAVPMIIIALLIRLDSPGPVVFRQERVTTYGKIFRIHKFRSMVCRAEENGPSLTVDGDQRFTGIGKGLRRFRLDELPQLLDVLSGNMSFVGTRPEIRKYVGSYRPEYYATLLMPAGITSEASIRYMDEEKLLSGADDVDRVYLEDILPAKMVWNLEGVRRFHLLYEGLTISRTILAICGKDYREVSVVEKRH